MNNQEADAESSSDKSTVEQFFKKSEMGFGIEVHRPVDEDDQLCVGIC